jgi:NADH-quinone oxidoreductase subunit H
VSAFYLGGLHGILPFLVKTLAVLFLMAMLQSLLTRLRIDQTVGLWWRFGTILVLAQIVIMILWKGGLL